MDLTHDIIYKALGPFAREDIERGVAAGRLVLPDERVTLLASGGALLAVMRDVLDGEAPENVDVPQTEMVLRMFGLSAMDAAEVANRPFPRVGDLPA